MTSVSISDYYRAISGDPGAPLSNTDIQFELVGVEDESTGNSYWQSQLVIRAALES